MSDQAQTRPLADFQKLQSETSQIDVSNVEKSPDSGSLSNYEMLKELRAFRLEMEKRETARELREKDLVAETRELRQEMAAMKQDSKARELRERQNAEKLAELMEKIDVVRGKTEQKVTTSSGKIDEVKEEMKEEDVKMSGEMDNAERPSMDPGALSNYEMLKEFRAFRLEMEKREAARESREKENFENLKKEQMEKIEEIKQELREDVERLAEEVKKELREIPVASQMNKSTDKTIIENISGKWVKWSSTAFRTALKAEGKEWLLSNQCFEVTKGELIWNCDFRKKVISVANVGIKSVVVTNNGLDLMSNAENPFRIKLIGRSLVIKDNSVAVTYHRK